MNAEMWFYVPGSHTGVDTARLVNGVWVGFYSNETQEQLALRYPGVILCDYETMLPQIKSAERAKFQKSPERITKEVFWNALEDLPPIDWRNDGVSESFKFQERISGPFTHIYARIGADYFMMCDDIRTPHAFIINQCQQVPA